MTEKRHNEMDQANQSAWSYERSSSNFKANVLTRANDGALVDPAKKGDAAR